MLLKYIMQRDKCCGPMQYNNCYNDCDGCDSYNSRNSCHCTKKYEKNNKNDVCYLPGQPGKPGKQGITGQQGPQGPQGNQGPQGPQGNQGPQGPQASQGSLGPQGSQGPQGPQGSQGSQGLQGPQGSQGSQGLPGPQGSQGSQGPQGPQGPQGSQGSQGSQGIITSAQYVQLGSQPATVAAGQPFTYTTAVLTTPNISASTAVFNPPFSASGTIFTLTNIGRYEINYQMTYPTDGGVVLYLGSTIPTMLPLPYTMIGKSPDGAVSGSVIIETTTTGSFLSVNAAAGNSAAIGIPPNSSTTNQNATTVSFKQIS
jgi:hypothetical protein